MELPISPPARNRTGVILVIAAGLVTTALALLGVYLLETGADTNIMGWHADYILPVGAILVGLAASSGYGIASYLTGLKIRKTLLWSILLLQVGAYFSAQYVTFLSQGPLFLRDTGHQVTFPEYFNIMATNFAWKKESGRGTDAPLGEAGYFFIGLEILGFAAGSLIVPGALMKHPYCELCQVYMKRKKLATIPASIPPRKVKKKDLAGMQAYTSEQQNALEESHAKLNYFAELAGANDPVAFRQTIEALGPASKASGKLPARVAIMLVRCRACHSGHLKATLLSGHGKKLTSTALRQIELTPEYVREMAFPSGETKLNSAPAAMTAESKPSQ